MFSKAERDKLYAGELMYDKEEYRYYQHHQWRGYTISARVDLSDNGEIHARLMGHKDKHIRWYMPLVMLYYVMKTRRAVRDNKED